MSFTPFSGWEAAVRDQPELTQVEADTVTRDPGRLGLRGVDFQPAAAEDWCSSGS
jgi:hypothetical protein